MRVATSVMPPSQLGGFHLSGGNKQAVVPAKPEAIPLPYISRSSGTGAQGNLNAHDIHKIPQQDKDENTRRT